MHARSSTQQARRLQGQYTNLGHGGRGESAVSVSVRVPELIALPSLILPPGVNARYSRIS
jgi:hypothetical protein